MGKHTEGNKNIKQQLIAIYGKQCMFERAKVAQKIEAMGGIDNFQTFVSKKKYKGKSISYQLSLHHLKHRSEGGDTSVENGALVSEIAHQYLHSLSRENEEIANNMLREWKINIIAMKGNQEIVQSLSYTPSPEDIIIPAQNITKEEYLKLQKKKEDKERIEEEER